MAAPVLQTQGATATAVTTGVPAVTIPTHQADDIIVVHALIWVPNTTTPDAAQIPTPAGGWALAGTQVGQPVSSPRDGWSAVFWFRATGAGHTVTLTRGTGWDTGTDTMYCARAYIIRGCKTSGNPFETTSNAGPHTAANQAFAAVSVSGNERMVVQFGAVTDNLAFAMTSSGWTTGTEDNDAGGTDCAFQTARKDNINTSTSADTATVTAPAAGFYAFHGISFVPPAAGSPIAGVASQSFGHGSSTLTGSGALAGTAVQSLGHGASILNGIGNAIGSCSLLLQAVGVLSQAPTIGPLAGTASQLLQGVGAMTGRGALVGSANQLLQGVGAMVGSGRLIGTAAVVITPVGSIGGRGVLSGAIQLALNSSGTLVGVGSLAGSTAAIISLNGVLSAASSNQLVGQIALALNATATLRGLAPLSGAASIQITPLSTLSGVGAMAGIAPMTIAPIGTLRGIGNLVGSIPLSIIPSGILSSLAGSLSGVASMNLNAQANLYATGNLAGVAVITISPTGVVSIFGSENTTERILAIAAENRAIAVAAENRSTIFAAEVRTKIFEAENRAKLLPSESRNLKLH